jgi:membrane protein DedA with SNARE-associated domain
MVMLSAVALLLCATPFTTAAYWLKQWNCISDDQYAKYIKAAGAVLIILLIAILVAIFSVLGESW